MDTWQDVPTINAWRGSVSFADQKKKEKKKHIEETRIMSLRGNHRSRKADAADWAVVQERLRIPGLPRTGVRGEVAP